MAEQPLTLPPGTDFHLEEFDPGYTGTYTSKQEAKTQIRQNLERLTDLQEMCSDDVEVSDAERRYRFSLAWFPLDRGTGEPD